MPDPQTFTSWAVLFRLEDGSYVPAAPGFRAALFNECAKECAFRYVDERNEILPAWPPLWKVAKVRVTVEEIEE